jgi:7-cyano-7-deazaguanine synthase
LQAAARVASSLGAAEHRVVSIDLRAFGGSALTADIAVPKTGVGEGIPVTYVPARNTVFLSFALAWAEVLSSSDVFIGVNAIDYSGYPDCRPEFIAAFENMANLATKAGVEGRTHLKIHAPLIQLSKCEIIELGARARRRLRFDAQLLRSGCAGPLVRFVRFVPAAPQRFCGRGSQGPS